MTFTAVWSSGLFPSPLDVSWSGVALVGAIMYCKIVKSHVPELMNIPGPEMIEVGWSASHGCCLRLYERQWMMDVAM